MLSCLDWIFSVKMSRRCLFGLLVLIGAGLVSGDRVYAILNGTIRFTPDNVKNTDLQSSITWKHKDDAGRVTKVIEWDSYDKTIETPNDKFKGHAELNHITGELTLKDLKQEHSGLYTIEIKSQEQEKKFTLTFMEAVPKPKLSKESAKNPDVLYLICEYNAKINWKCSNEKKFETAPLDSPKKGQLLTFNKTGNPEVCCTCTLTNAVSEETSDPLCEKDLFPAKSDVLGITLGIVIPIVLIAILYGLYKKYPDTVQSLLKCTPCKGEPKANRTETVYTTVGEAKNEGKEEANNGKEIKGAQLLNNLTQHSEHVLEES